MQFVFNLILSASVIATTAWLSRSMPVLAGFIVALPITTMLVLPLSHADTGSTENTVLLARSIFIAIPVSMTFFVPFLLSNRLGLGFWQCYGAGCGLLVIGFFVHQAITNAFFQTGA